MLRSLRFRQIGLHDDSIFEWGGMFQGGDRPLHGPCGEFDSRPLHQISSNERKRPMNDIVNDVETIEDVLLLLDSQDSDHNSEAIDKLQKLLLEKKETISDFEGTLSDYYDDY